MTLERLFAATAALVAAALSAWIGRLQMTVADEWGILCGAHRTLAHCPACYAAVGFAALGLAVLAWPALKPLPAKT